MRLRISEPEVEDHLLTAEFENLSSKMSALCISQDFVSEMREAFYLFDKDQNGYICSKELGALLRTLGCNPTEAEVNTLMASIDVDHNGRIDLLEFIVMMHQTVGRTDTMEEIRMAFRAFDTDGDGLISKDEFRSCMLNFGERFTEDEIVDMVKQADSDRNGFIDFPEFVQMITNEEVPDHRKLITS